LSDAFKVVSFPAGHSAWQKHVHKTPSKVNRNNINDSCK
jgi:hypothetical protein